MRKNNKRKTIKEARDLFKQKDAILLCDKYVNTHTKMEFICNRHKELGVQYATYYAAGKNECICKECIRLNKLGRSHNVPNRIDNHYNELFAKYENKLKEQENGSEYVLNKIYSKNGRTMLDLIHLKCNEHYHVEQNKFFKIKNRCQNPSCKFKRRSQQKLKSLEQVKKEVSDLIGDEYEIISDYVGTNENVTFYHKLCDNTFKMTPHNFLAGQRCPHCTITPSTGECAIINILKKMNVKYTFQKSFDDLVGYCGYPLSYDFYLPKFNLLIEYQGEYHDGSISFIPQTKIQKAQEYDQIKREYAKSHGIDLLEIWYWDFDNIENILKETLNKIQLVV